MKPTLDRDAKPQSASRTVQSPARGHVVAEEGEGISRLMVTTIVGYLSRIERERRQLYGDDLDLGTIFEVISIGAIEPGLRDPNFRAAHGTFNTVVGVEGQRGINAMSIAAATGIPRETVRRKLKRLVARGFILEKTKGNYIVTPGRLLSADYQTAFSRGIRETLRMINECLDQGLIKWVPGSETGKPPSKE